MRRALAFFITVCLLITLLPTNVLASETESSFVDPEITEFTVTYMDENVSKSVSLLDENSPQIVMDQGCMPIFTVKFNTSDLLDKVYITSTKDGETKYLEAFSDDSTVYVTEGYFEPDDTGYIPGAISVTYTKKSVAVSENSTVNGIDLSELKTQLESSGISVIGDMTSADDGSVSAQVVLGEYFDGIMSVVIDEFESESGVNSGVVKDWLGLYEDLKAIDLNGVENSRYFLYFSEKDWLETDSYLMVLRDADNSKYIKMTLSAVGLKDLAETLSTAGTVSKVCLDYIGISKEADALREQIEAHPTMTTEQKAESNAKIDALETDKQLFLLGMTVIPLFFSTAGVSAPLMISALLAGYSSVSEHFWNNRIGMIQGCDTIRGAFSAGSEHEGNWIALTNNVLDEYDHGIQKSGKYYLAEDVSSILVSTRYKENPAPIDVTICLHGHRVDDNIYTNGLDADVSLQICDCKYDAEHPNGSVTGILPYIRVSEGCIVTIESGIFRYVETSGTTTIAGGTITGGRMTCFPDGFLNIEGGVIGGEIENRGGTLNISGGTILNDGDYCIDNSCYDNIQGTVNISGGTVINKNTEFRSTCISNSGKVDIHAGLIESAGTSAINNSAAGMLTISGGVIRTTEQNDDTATYAIVNSGTLRMSAGTISGWRIGISNSGILSIDGGLVEAGYGSNAEDGTTRSCTVIDNTGEMVLNGGVVKAIGDDTCGIENDGGNFHLSGGTITTEGWDAGLSNRREGVATISKGTVIGWINNYYSPVKIIITENSEIELNAENYSSYLSRLPLSIEAEEGYMGKVQYYASPNDVGTEMTISDAENTLKSTASDSMAYWVEPYVRLVADTADDDPNLPAFCEHLYTSTVNEPTCSESGYTTYMCSKCGDSYIADEVSAIGHTADTAWEKDGIYHWHSCIDCGEILESTKAAHIYVNGVCDCDIEIIFDKTAGTVTLKGVPSNVVHAILSVNVGGKMLYCTFVNSTDSTQIPLSMLQKGNYIKIFYLDNYYAPVLTHGYFALN